MLLRMIVCCTLPLVVYNYENIALHKKAWQLNPYKYRNYNASKAVDGLKTNLEATASQCTISEEKYKTAIWWVDLNDIIGVHHITIYYRTDNVPWGPLHGYVGRFLGFSVFISNTTEKEDGVLCFKDDYFTNETIPAVLTLNCTHHGRYVIYYNNRTSTNLPPYYSQDAYNELCEFEVYGCSDPIYYSENCSQSCPTRCNNSHCHIETGHCFGCVDGYQGSACEQQCQNNTYGAGCSENCGHCMDGEQCNHVNGTCPNGCEAGFYEIRCKTECSPGIFGINCLQNCSKNCYNESSCNGSTGACLGGCISGWRLPGCTEECVAGKYGKNCSQDCSRHCNDSMACDKKTGVCDGGCVDGWKWQMCNIECDDGTYGTNCGSNCGHCYQGQSCDKKTGACLYGCGPGYDGMYCNKTCAPTNYGPNCKLTCSRTCLNQTCDSMNGSCIMVSLKLLDKTDSNNIAPAIGGSLVVVFVVLLVVVVVVVTVLRRRKSRRNQQMQRSQQKPQTRTPYENTIDLFSNVNENNIAAENIPLRDNIDQPEALDVDVDENVHLENPYRDMYVNEQYFPDILIKDIGSAIMKKTKSENDGFKREYAYLPYGERFPCNIGKLEVNVHKNRYKTTFPYDHSRVILRQNTGSEDDYINANYIHGHERKNEYIASQGPKESTMGNFWEMVCQDQVKQIIMLTNLKEGKRLKCHQYWPDVGKKELYGTISVKSIEEKQYAFYTLRKFQVSEKGMNSYVAKQFHYTTWPDHGTPDPLCLVIFLSHVTHEKPNQDLSPTVVHCSAGIGRTGTYVALDSLYQAGNKSGRVNVAEYVKTMRANRLNMIQTYEQYMTVFLSLYEAFRAAPDPKATNTFLQRVTPMFKNVPSNYSALKTEYELLRKICPIYTKTDYKNALQDMPKSRRDAILPLDRFGLELTSNVSTRGRFINAIVVSSYTKESAFIVTHYPTPEDTVDFLRLLSDYQSCTVVCMDPLHKIDSSKSWMPVPSSEKIVSPYRVVCNTCTDSDVRVSTINIYKDREEPHSVTVAEPKSDLKTNNFNHTSSLRSLVSFALNCPNDNQVTVVSKDGASLCGVFCAVFNSIQQITLDDNIDVFTTVRQLQTRRPEFCSTQDEYDLIYQAVYDHLQATSENVYYNQ